MQIYCNVIKVFDWHFRRGTEISRENKSFLSYIVFKDDLLQVLQIFKGSEERIHKITSVEVCSVCNGVVQYDWT